MYIKSFIFISLSRDRTASQTLHNKMSDLPLFFNKVCMIKRKIQFLEWMWLKFHWMKWKNVYFMSGQATHEIYIFHFIQWNKSHFHSKNLNNLYMDIWDSPCYLYLYEVQQAEKGLGIYAKSDGSGETVQMHRLNRTFFIYMACTCI